MRFYQIAETVNGLRFYATLDEAKKAAREAAKELDRTIEVKRVTCGADKASRIKLANGLDWCQSAETVYNAKPRGLTNPAHQPDGVTLLVENGLTLQEAFIALRE